MTMIDDVLGEVAATLGGEAPEHLLAVASEGELWVFTAYDEGGTPRGKARLTDAYPTGDELAAALARGDREARSAALPILFALAPAKALPFAVRLLDADVSQEAAQSFASGVMQAVWAKLPEILPTMSEEAIADLWLRGRLGSDVVPAVAMAKARVEALIDAVLLGRVSFIAGVDKLRDHPGLARGDQIVAALERLIAPSVTRRDNYLVGFLLARLGELRFEPAVPLLAGAFRRRERSLDRNLADALSAIGSEDASAALVERIAIVAGEAHPWDPHHGIPELAIPIRAAFERAPASAYDRLSPWLSPEGDTGARILKDILIAVGRRPEWVAADPRWIDLGLRLAKDARLGPTVKRLLDGAGKEAVKEAKARQAAAAPVEATGRRKKAAQTAPAPRRWLERYRAGEHEAVWKEMTALGDAARDGAARSDAEAVARETMARVRENLDRIVTRLRQAGYAFADEAAVGAPEATVASSIRALEGLLGAPVPLSLAAFYEVVGSIDLSEGEASYADGEKIFAMVGDGDPLVILPAEQALALARELAGAGALSEPVVYLGPDPERKADPDRRVADEAPYVLYLAGAGADGIVRQGVAPERSFVDFLRHAVRWGGFPIVPGADGDPAKHRAGLAVDLLPF